MLSTLSIAMAYCQSGDQTSNRTFESPSPADISLTVAQQFDLHSDYSDLPSLIQHTLDSLDPDLCHYHDPVHGQFNGLKEILRQTNACTSPLGRIRLEHRGQDSLYESGDTSISVHSWQLFIDQDGDWLSVVAGVTVRHFKAGKVYALHDYYDSMQVRLNAPYAAQLPSWERPPSGRFFGSTPTFSANALAWLAEVDHTSSSNIPLSNRDCHDIVFGKAFQWQHISALLNDNPVSFRHPVYGEFQDAGLIKKWLEDIMPRMGSIVYEGLSNAYFSEDHSAQEWQQVIVLPTGEGVIASRGVTLCRYSAGRIIAVEQVFDSAPLHNPEILECARIAGSTITPDMITKYIQPDFRAGTTAKQRLNVQPASSDKPSGALLTASEVIKSRPQQDKDKPSYHHGNLRSELIREATRIVEEEGNSAQLTLRALARAAGVSHAAPYHHFKDKAALILALATEFHWDLLEFMAEHTKDVIEPAERLKALAASYLEFGSEHSGRYRLLFAPEVRDVTYSEELRQAVDASITPFIGALVDLSDGKEDIESLTLSAWSLVHSLTGVLVSEQLNPEQSGETERQTMIEKITGVFVKMS